MTFNAKYKAAVEKHFKRLGFRDNSSVPDETKLTLNMPRPVSGLHGLSIKWQDGEMYGGKVYAQEGKVSMLFVYAPKPNEVEEFVDEGSLRGIYENFCDDNKGLKLVLYRDEYAAFSMTIDQTKMPPLVNYSIENKEYTPNDFAVRLYDALEAEALRYINRELPDFIEDSLDFVPYDYELDHDDPGNLSAMEDDEFYDEDEGDN